MAFTGDYHTHSIFSHGEGTIEENVLKAISLGFTEIAITDHGFKHMTYNVRRMDWSYIQNEARIMREKYPQIKILLGLETNFNSNQGNVDILPTDLRQLDILVCGYHMFVFPSNFVQMFAFYLPTFLYSVIGKTPAGRKVKNTDLYIKALEKYDIDILSHINCGLDVDVREVAKACKHFGTYIELNGKRINFTADDVTAVAEEGAEFICNSDAHTIANVGNMELPLKVIKELNIPMSMVANWDRLPILRSQIGKKV